MVAVKPQQADAFVKAPPRGICAVLLHGSDAGLVSERAQLLAKAIAAAADPPGEILRIGDDDLETDPDRLAVELGTLPMFGGRKVVRTNQSRKVGTATLKPMIEERRIEGVLIVEAGALKADDSLRALFEKSDQTAAIACYADEARDLDGLIRDVLQGHGLNIAPDAKRTLIGRLGADRALSRAEIEKLALYALGKGTIEDRDVEAVVGDASELAIDKIISAAAMGRADLAVSECERSVASGESPQYIVIAAMRHLQRLHRVRMALESGASLDDAMRGLRPPVFFKQKDAFAAQVERWSSAKLVRALSRTTETQRAMRAAGQSTRIDEAVLAEALLLDLARLAAHQPSAARTASP